MGFDCGIATILYLWIPSCEGMTMYYSGFIFCEVLKTVETVMFSQYFLWAARLKPWVNVLMPKINFFVLSIWQSLSREAGGGSDASEGVGSICSIVTRLYLWIPAYAGMTQDLLKAGIQYFCSLKFSITFGSSPHCGTGDHSGTLHDWEEILKTPPLLAKRRYFLAKKTRASFQKHA